MRAPCTIRLRGIAVVLGLLTILVGSPRTAAAHPLHTAVTELRLESDGALSLRVRTFADDFSAAVARATRTAVLPNHQVSDAAAARYVASVVTLQVAGVAVGWRLVAQRRDGDVTWLEFRAERSWPSLRDARFVNRMLMEFHADQVNVLKAQYDGRSFTTLFSRGEGAKALP